MIRFTSYKNRLPSYKKPFKSKVTPLKKDRTARRQEEKSRRVLFYVKALFFLMLCSAGIYGLFFTSLFEIQKIDVEGPADTLEEQNALSNYFQKYLGKNLLLFNPRTIEIQLLQDYTYLKTLDIDRDFFHGIQVRLETYPAVANVQIEFEDGSKQFLIMNEQGYVASVGVAAETLPLIVMNFSGSAPELNQELIPQETLNLLLETSRSFEGKFDMQVLEIHYLEQARELHLYTERNFSIWIDLTKDTAIQLAKLKKALTELNIYEAHLEYVDLRISGQNGEKVIYKLRAS